MKTKLEYKKRYLRWIRLKRYLILVLFIFVFSGLLTFILHLERFFLLSGLMYLFTIFLGGIMTAYEGCLMYKSEYGFYIRPFSQPKKIEQTGKHARRAGIVYIIQGFVFGVLLPILLLIAYFVY